LSARILAYRHGRQSLEVLLVRPGGPYWRNKDDGAWSISKSEIGALEDLEQTARGELAEEFGPVASLGPPASLREICQRGGKHVIAFCGETDFDTACQFRNTFESFGRREAADFKHFRRPTAQSWFDLETARSVRADRTHRSTGGLEWRDHINSASCGPLVRLRRG
jgi:predicted NUDIX family NTP pyrophosphohydrolase